MTAVHAANQKAADVLTRAAQQRGDSADLGTLPAVEAAESTESPAVLQAVAEGEEEAARHLQAAVDRLSEQRQAQSIETLRRAGLAVLVFLLIVFAGSVAFARATNDGEGLPHDAALPLAVGTILAVYLLLAALRRGFDGVAGLLVGADGRLSTSKTTAALWTATLVLAVLHFTYSEAITDEFDVDPLYFLLLGGPFAAWVLASSATQSKLASGTLQKTDSDQVQPTLDLVSNDDGELSLTDLQYLGFNLAVLVYFFVSLNLDGDQLPDLPAGLVALTSAGALTYLGTKSLAANSPYITSVQPLAGQTRIRAGQRVTIRGGNFVPPGAGGDIDTLAGVRVQFSSGSAQRIMPVVPRLDSDREPNPSPPRVRRRRTNPSRDRLQVRVPLDMPGHVDVAVVTLAGAVSSPVPIHVDGPQEATVRSGTSTVPSATADTSPGQVAAGRGQDQSGAAT